MKYDVFKVFANNAHLGGHTNLVRGDQPLDEEYVKFALLYAGHTSNSFHGASQGGSAEQRLVFYVPKSQLNVDIYDDVTLPAPGSGNEVPITNASPDETLGQLITVMIAADTPVAVGNWLNFVPQAPSA